MSEYLNEEGTLLLRDKINDKIDKKADKEFKTDSTDEYKLCISTSQRM